MRPGARAASSTAKRRTPMFSPILAISVRRASSTLLAPLSGSASSASSEAGARRAATAATCCAKARKSCSRATKSVSQFTSTMAADAPIGRGGNGDHAFGGDARCFLVGFGKPLLAHELRGRVKVAARLDQRLLALHHAGAGALAQLLDCLCCDRHALSPLFAWRFAFIGAHAGFTPRRAGAEVLGHERRGYRCRNNLGFLGGVKLIQAIDRLPHSTSTAILAGGTTAPRRRLLAHRRLRAADDRADSCASAGRPRRARQIHPRPPRPAEPRPCPRAPPQPCHRRTG